MRREMHSAWKSRDSGLGVPSRVVASPCPEGDEPWAPALSGRASVTSKEENMEWEKYHGVAIFKKSNLPPLRATNLWETSQKRTKDAEREPGDLQGTSWKRKVLQSPIGELCGARLQEAHENEWWLLARGQFQQDDQF